MEVNVTMVTMEVELTQEDSDGSEILELYISNLPHGVLVPDAEHLSDSSWKLLLETNVVSFNITAEPSYLYPMSINMTVVSRETSNNDRYESLQTFDLELCHGATSGPQDIMPTVGSDSTAGFPGGNNVTVLSRDEATVQPVTGSDSKANETVTPPGKFFCI